MADRSQLTRSDLVWCWVVRVGSPEYDLTVHEFAVLWTDLALGREPSPLELPKMGRTGQEQAMYTAEVRRGLRASGIITGRGRVDDRLESMLRLLAGPYVAVNLVGYVGYQVRALAATDGRSDVLAVQAGGEVWLTAIRSAGLSAAIVGVLPTACPAHSRPHGPLEVAVPGEFAAQCRATGRFGFSVTDTRPVTCFATGRGWYLATPDGGVKAADLADIQRCIERALGPLYKS